MPRVECPECGGQMKVADDLPAGRKVRCPKCEAVFRPFEEKRDPPEERVRGGAAASPPAADRPRRPREDEDERDDEDEDRPRRRPTKKGKGPVYWVLLAFAGLAAAVSIGFLIFTLLWRTEKMDLDKSFDLKAGESQMFGFPPVSREQTIKVSVTATGGKVRVYVYVEKGDVDVKNYERDRLRNPILKQMAPADDIKLDGNIPADHTAIVVVESLPGSTPQVKLRVTN